ncbi:MAG: two-component system response regulator [Planctomycetaceae bacterium]|nr:MAG: two-component system response regulator [Planctomycetaceae bacterium]
MLRILLADDDNISAELTSAALESFGYEVTTVDNGRDAMHLLRSGRYRLLISDWEMPEISGLELCQWLRQRRAMGYVYVILLTSHNQTRYIVQGLQAGADDFLSKPFDPHELQMRVSVGERLLGLESRDLLIFALAKLAESRDVETGSHLERIREYCRVLAEELCSNSYGLQELQGDFIEEIFLTSPLHDIGKVGIPDKVLLKPGRLTPMEYDVMKQHTLIGAHTLDAVLKMNSDAAYLGMARDIALSHHEWFNGKGYPQGLSGDQIPLAGRIVALADVYDALTSKRVYKPAFSHEEAREIILANEGKQFDPRIVQAFLKREDEFVLIKERYHQDMQSHFDGARAVIPAELNLGASI